MGLGRLAIAGQDTWRRNFWLCAGEVGVRAFAERIRHTSRGVARRGLGRVQAAPMRPPSPGFFISVDGSVDIPGTVLISRVDKKRLTVFSDGAGGTMAEVGLLPFARVALEVATQVLPPYRTRFTKHQFTHPQLLAGRFLIGHQDWILPEAATRLREHPELRAPIKILDGPDY